jgi:hypothetical protein
MIIFPIPNGTLELLDELGINPIELLDELEVLPTLSLL